MSATARDPVDVALERRLRHQDRSKPSHPAPRGQRTCELSSRHPGRAWHPIQQGGTPEPSITGISTEELVGAFAADPDRDLAPSEFSDRMRRDQRLVGERLVKARK
jgi:hypothetical protein